MDGGKETLDNAASVIDCQPLCDTLGRSLLGG